MHETAASSRFRTIDLAYIALFTALLAICSWISIPMPKPLVPFTLQTFAVFLILQLLGGERGLCAVVVYLLLGAIGLPVFAGFRGGLGSLLGTTGGYLLGFIAMALVYWALTAHHDGKPVRIAACVLGLAVCYTFGTAWFLIVYARTTGPIGLTTALGWCVLPFLIPDGVKLALSVLLAERLRPFVK